QGAAGRLLSDRRAGSRCGAVLGSALPGRESRHDRGPPRLDVVAGLAGAPSGIAWHSARPRVLLPLPAGERDGVRGFGPLSDILGRDPAPDPRPGEDRPLPDGEEVIGASRQPDANEI